MSTPCPHCNHVRLASEIAPEWQCPSCGVAYYKKAKMKAPDIPWGKWLMIAAVIYGAWTGVQVAQEQFGGIGWGGEMTTDDIRALAATVKPGEILVYGAEDCSSCGQAKKWLNQYGFTFSYCDIDDSEQCGREYLRHGGIGTPLIIVRGHIMHGLNTNNILKELHRSKT